MKMAIVRRLTRAGLGSGDSLVPPSDWCHWFRGVRAHQEHTGDGSGPSVGHVSAGLSEWCLLPVFGEPRLRDGMEDGSAVCAGDPVVTEAHLDRWIPGGAACARTAGVGEGVFPEANYGYRLGGGGLARREGAVAGGRGGGSGPVGDVGCPFPIVRVSVRIDGRQDEPGRPGTGLP